MRLDRPRRALEFAEIAAVKRTHVPKGGKKVLLVEQRLDVVGDLA
jgi:hypothetical protein